MGGHASKVGEYPQAGVDVAGVALIVARDGGVQFVGNHAFARPAVDKSDGVLCVAGGEDVVECVGVDAPVADDGDGVMAYVALKNAFK